MEEAWHAKCSSGWTVAPAVPVFPPLTAGSCNQINVNGQQFYHPDVLQAANLGNSQLLQEPLLPCISNKDLRKSGNLEAGNSFLSLLSGRSYYLSGELLPTLNPSSELSKLPISDRDAFRQSSTRSFSSNFIPPLSKYHCNDAIFNGVLPSFVASRPLATDLSKDLQPLVPHSDILGSSKAFSRHFSEDVTRGIGVSSRGFGSSSPSCSAFLHQNNQASQNLPLDANVHDIISPLHFRDHPRVLCMNTAGELFVDDMGFLGVLCSCHSFPMSVAKFCQHSGLTSTIPCDVIRMESGMTLAQWCKMCFGNLTLGDRRGPDQSKKNSVASIFSSLSKNHGELRRSEELKDDTLYAHCPNLMGKVSMDKPAINDMNYENEERNSGVNGLLHLTGSTQGAIPITSENTNLQFVRETPEFLNTQRLLSTPNRREPNAASQLFASNVNFGSRSRNTSASHAPAGPKKNLMHGKNISTRGSSSNDALVIDRNGSDLRLGQPSQDKHSSSSFFPTAINLSLPPVCFSPELQQQNKLSDRTDFDRETKRARLNRPSPLPETSTSVRRTPHPENRTTFSLHNSESEDLLTKDSSISLFLSHLTGGTGLSDCSNRTLDVPSTVATSINCDLLSSRENLSWCTRNEIDEIGKASSFNEIHYFNSKGKFPNGVSDSSRNMENIDVHSKQIEDRRVNRPSINRQSFHSFPANMGKPSLFSNQPFRSLYKGTDYKNSNKNGKMAILEDGCHLSNIIVRGSEIRATQCGGLPGCIESEAPINLSSTNSSHISETNCLSCKENVKFQDHLMDGNSRFLASSRHGSLMDKHEQLSTIKTNSNHISETNCLSCKENVKFQDHLMDGNSRFLASSRHGSLMDKHEQLSTVKRKSQHGKLCCLSAMESHRNSCTDDLVGRKNGTYFNIHQSESDLRSGSNCHYNNPFGALHCDPGSGASYNCCNCATSAQKTSPCSTFSSHHICGTKHHLCFRPREICSDTSLDNEYEMCIYKRGGHPVCGNCCCATFSKCLVGCSFNGAVNTPDIMNDQSANGMLKHINPTFEKVVTFQSGKTIELEQNTCFKKTVSAQNNNQTGFWRDASSKIVGSSAAIPENRAETSDAACKELDGTSIASMSLDAQQIFDRSRSSAPAITEISVEVNKRNSQISNVNSGMILHYSLFDEGSGIEKCSSSDERPNTKKCEVVETSGMSSPSCNNIVAEFKFSGSSKKKGVRNKITAECTEQENSQRHQLTRVCKLRKRKEPYNSDEYNDAVPDSDFLLAHSEPPESIDELPLSKRVGISMEPANAVEGTCLISSGSSNIKQKRSDFPSSKFVSLKKLGDQILLSNNVHLPEESKNSVPVVEKLDFSLHGKQDPVKRLNHQNGERPRKYMSLSSIVDSRNHESGTSTISKRPVVSGNSGIISSGDLNALQKSPKIVPVNLILKKARRCTSNSEVELKSSLISKMECTGVKDQNCSEFSSCKSPDGSGSPYLGRRSKVGVNKQSMSGRESHLSILDSRKGIKGGWYAEIRSRNISMNRKADTGDRWKMHKKRNSRNEPSSVGVALCCVCGSSNKETTNCLLECNRCLISVHQACYGISEVPKDVWYCRSCKRNSRNIEFLQSEIDEVDPENIGIYGKCMLHARNDYHTDSPPMNVETPSHIIKEWSCARTEGFKGRGKGRFPNYQIPFNDGDGCIVSQVQINAWVHINGQKSCIRGGVEPECSDVEHDLRKEYIRYKLSKGWKHLVVYNSSIHDLGLYTSRFITRGAMVVEYVGEVVGLRVADKREIEYQSGRRLQCKSACYFFRIDMEQIIDATRKGGIARFVNHSCLPNCVAKVISIKNEKKVIFFAERDINPGEEVTYDYHFNREDEGFMYDYEVVDRPPAFRHILQDIRKYSSVHRSSVIEHDIIQDIRK